MCESQVSGCQFPVVPVVKAQTIPSRVGPACTVRFSVTYAVSSYVTKSWPATPQ